MHTELIGGTPAHIGRTRECGLKTRRGQGKPSRWLLQPKVSKVRNQRENENESSTPHCPQNYPLLLPGSKEVHTTHKYHETDSSC